ncbi:MAG: DNA ligase D, partial [Polyangiaceae bacterium]|nr:DNA ligase D [Polyangiaceae bacterium]
MSPPPRRPRRAPAPAGPAPEPSSVAPPTAAERLADYRDKRDPARTPEPFGPLGAPAGATTSGAFVVHLHAATRTHYDLRLEVGGVLKSFAVPRGPSLDPGDRRLAVETEDHPRDYLEFEDVIPDGSYGAGPMIAWDLGRVRYLEGTAEDGIRRGKIDFELYGYKLRGRFGLVDTTERAARQAGRAPPARQWLLLKKSDAHAKPGTDVTLTEPESVLSGLRVTELAQKDELARALVGEAARLGAPARPLDARALGPMLCATPPETAGEADAALLERLLVDPERLYELKLDGVRIVADKRAGTVALRYRTDRDAGASFPEIARAVRALAPERVVLDGEIVAFDARGLPSFERVLRRVQVRRAEDVRRAQAEVPVAYVVFDLLALGDRDLTPLPLADRKALLLRLCRGRGLVRALDHLEGDGRPLYALCLQERLEGVVAKRRSARYRGERSEDWLKVKCQRDDELVVVGWERGQGSRTLGALYLASYEAGAGDGHERLVLRGKVGSGIDAATEKALLGRLEALSVPHSPAEGSYDGPARARRYVRPELVVSVRFLGWSDAGNLRQPVFRGVRDDVEPTACRAAPPREPELPDAGPPAALVHAGRVALTNQAKVFWPEDGLTKGDLCAYYAAIAPTLLPYLRGRPLVLVRHPDGITGKSFYQWNPPLHDGGAWVRSMVVRAPSADEPEDARARPLKRAFLVDDAEGLVYLANLGCIPIHVLAYRQGSPEACDFLTFDFDPGEGDAATQREGFRRSVALALSLRALLGELGLEGHAKTSGQDGLHVLVPLGPGVPFAAAKMLCELVGRLLVLRHPDTATMERRIADRRGRVYVDTGQTGRSRSIVAPYSVRAVPGARVSTPLTWSEVHLGLDPARHTLSTVPERVAAHGDPMRPLLDAHPDVA